MIRGCEDYAQEHALAPLAMAVYDRAGNPILFVIQDNAMQAVSAFAMAKARTAAITGLATGALGDLDYENHERPMGIANMPGLTVAQGGLPISTENGEHIGGIGVSGASSTEDEACSRAAIDAVKSLLK
ncbi:conserved domain protein [Luminiphilus syltensis NOR5-1B]|uniref:Conserved domain protein n=2 Tax=Luminiphilus TaxID=1341118 RepID=B8KV62_9GAMM|nr:conserved domain protein [Luminiphilus syltensis NOR5-1B]